MSTATPSVTSYLDFFRGKKIEEALTRQRLQDAAVEEQRRRAKYTIRLCWYRCVYLMILLGMAVYLLYMLDTRCREVVLSAPEGDESLESRTIPGLTTSEPFATVIPSVVPAYEVKADGEATAYDQFQWGGDSYNVARYAGTKIESLPISGAVSITALKSMGKQECEDRIRNGTSAGFFRVVASDLVVRGIRMSAGDLIMPGFSSTSPSPGSVADALYIPFSAGGGRKISFGWPAGFISVDVSVPEIPLPDALPTLTVFNETLLGNAVEGGSLTVSGEERQVPFVELDIVYGYRWPEGSCTFDPAPGPTESAYPQTTWSCSPADLGGQPLSVSVGSPVLPAAVGRPHVQWVEANLDTTTLHVGLGRPTSGEVLRMLGGPNVCFKLAQEEPVTVCTSLTNTLNAWVSLLFSTAGKIALIAFALRKPIIWAKEGKTSKTDDEDGDLEMGDIKPAVIEHVLTVASGWAGEADHPAVAYMADGHLCLDGILHVKEEEAEDGDAFDESEDEEDDGVVTIATLPTDAPKPARRALLVVPSADGTIVLTVNPAGALTVARKVDWVSLAGRFRL